MRILHDPDGGIDTMKLSLVPILTQTYISSTTHWNLSTSMLTCNRECSQCFPHPHSSSAAMIVEIDGQTQVCCRSQDTIIEVFIDAVYDSLTDQE